MRYAVVSLHLASKLTVAALLVAAVGIVIQIISGADYPAVPPGLIILLVAAGLLSFGRWRWTPIVGIAVGLFLLFGLFAAGQAHRLFTIRSIGDAVGLWIQLLAAIVAVTAGIGATAQNYRGRAPDVERGR